MGGAVGARFETQGVPVAHTTLTHHASSLRPYTRLPLPIPRQPVRCVQVGTWPP